MEEGIYIMDIIEIIGNVVVFIIAFGIIGLGIFVIAKSKIGKGKYLTNAVVVNCENVDEAFGEGKANLHNITLDIQTSNGTMPMMIESDRIFKPGAKCRVYYNIQSGNVEFVAKSMDNAYAVGSFFIVFGLCLCLWTAVCIYCVEGGANVGIILPFAVTFLFTYVGFYGGILQPAIRKKQMVDCRKVTGIVVDPNLSRGNSSNMVSAPIYSFYYEGNEYRMRSIVSSSSAKRAVPGRRVNIVINEKTGEVYCVEDQSIGVSIVFGIIGLLVGVFTLVGSGLL